MSDRAPNLRPEPEGIRPAGPTETPQAVPLAITSEQLFQNERSVRIFHAGQCYLLRITRENKLILTK